MISNKYDPVLVMGYFFIFTLTVELQIPLDLCHFKLNLMIFLSISLISRRLWFWIRSSTSLGTTSVSNQDWSRHYLLGNGMISIAINGHLRNSSHTDIVEIIICIRMKFIISMETYSALRYKYQFSIFRMEIV